MIFLTDLLNERIGIIKAKKEQNEMITKINELGNIVLLEEKIRGAIKKVKTKTQRRKNYFITKECYKKCNKVI